MAVSWLVWGLLVLLHCVSGAEICCPGAGCYDDDPPFDHFPLPDCNEDIQVSARVFTRFNRNNGEAITRSSIPAAYRQGLRTVFVTHGWLGNENHFYLHDIKNELLDKANYNVIVVGWRNGANEAFYPKSASNTRVVGTEIGLIARHIVQNTITRSDDLWCVGHSLGGHTCGFAGKFTSFGRITGLDPAGPWFEGEDPRARINPNDADFVDVIHTNTMPGLVLPLGIMQQCGDVDYYPNGGGLQPGCILDPLDDDLTPACSHLRVLWLFEESINSQCQFYAREHCTDEEDIPGSCRACSGIGICGAMGYHAEDYSFRGAMHFETNPVEPYCRG